MLFICMLWPRSWLALKYTYTCMCLCVYACMHVCGRPHFIKTCMYVRMDICEHTYVRRTTCGVYVAVNVILCTYYVRDNVM